MCYLPKYLHKLDIVTGPIEEGNTSYSGLEVLRKYILGIRQFQGGEHFLNFGSALHEWWLQSKKAKAWGLLDEDEQGRILAMTIVLNKHVVAKKLIEGSVREVKEYGYLNGVKLSYILDIHHPKFKRGADLKTTTCQSFEDFVDKAREYGYFKQAYLYMKLAGLKEFYFIGINKFSPFKIFILNVNDYPDDMAYAEQEVNFLLYFYKHYGKINDGSMKKTGKEALAELKAQQKVCDEAFANLIKAIKAYAKNSNKLDHLVKKFPKDEAPLYVEKLVKFKAKQFNTTNGKDQSKKSGKGKRK